jgi:hypothetical protein
MKNKEMVKNVEAARVRWIESSENASKLALEVYQPGSGYGDPQAEAGDKYRVEAARADAQRLMQEYHDIDRQLNEQRISDLQSSQTLATWASFTVALVVGVATIVGTLLQLIK